MNEKTFEGSLTDLGTKFNKLNERMTELERAHDAHMEWHAPDGVFPDEAALDFLAAFYAALSQRYAHQFPVKGDSWKEMSIPTLADLLRREWDELAGCDFTDERLVMHELVDLALMAAMCWGRYELWRHEP